MLLLKNFQRETSDDLLIDVIQDDNIQDICYYIGHKKKTSVLYKYQIKDTETPLLEINCKHKDVVRAILDINKNVS